MKKLKLFFACLLMAVLSIGQMWAADAECTLSNANIVAGGSGATGYSSKTMTDGCSQTWNAYAIKNQHSKATSEYHYLQIRAYNSSSSTAYYLQVPEKSGYTIKSITMVVSGSSQPRTGGGNSATLFFSASNSTTATGTGVASGTGTSSVTINCSSLGLTTGYITASGAVRIWGDVTVTYTPSGGPSTPTISADPEGATYGVGDAATALSVTAAPHTTGKTLSYKWYSNSSESTDGATQVGTDETYTPSTSSAGTTYYYCVVSEQDGGSATSGFAAVQVKAKHNIIFNNGGVKTIVNASVREGETYNITETIENSLIASCTYKKFEGWTRSSSIVNANVKPTLVTSVEMEDEDVDLYAVYSITSGSGSGAAVDATLFSENFGGFVAGDKMEGSQSTETGNRFVYNSGSVTYSYSNGTSADTKIYEQTSAGGSSPELLVGKNNSTFTITGIPTGSANTAILTYHSNQSSNLTVSTTTENVTIGNVSTDATDTKLCSRTITFSEGAASTFNMTFTMTTSSNARLDDIEIIVATTDAGGSTTYSLDAGCAAAGQCFAPTFSPAAGTFDAAQSIELATTTAEADIYYTLDGETTPSKTSGTKYNGTPISVTQNTTIKAIAIKDAMDPSEVATGVFNIRYAQPTFSVASGDYDEAQNVTITATGADAIYYTTNGIDPIVDPANLYDGNEIEINTTGSHTIKAIAVKAGYANSNVASATYEMDLPYANIAAFITAEPTTAKSLTLNNAIITGVDGTTLYIQDETAGIMIYGLASLPENAAPNHSISGTIVGKYSLYKHQHELVKPNNTTPIDISNVTISADEVARPAINEYTSLSAAYAAKPMMLVKLTDVRYDGTQYEFSGNKIYNTFGALTGKTMPETTVNCDITGVVIDYNGTLELLPVFATDIVADADAADPTVNPAGGVDAENAVTAAAVEITADAGTKVDGLASKTVDINSAIPTEVTVEVTRDFYRTVNYSCGYYKAAAAKYNINGQGATTEGTVVAKVADVEAATAAEGDEVHVFITPNAHFHFESITINKNEGTVATTQVAEGTEYSFTMPDEAVTIAVTYTQDQQATLTFAKGEATGTEDAPTAITDYVGETVQLPANPFTYNGYKFIGWSCDGGTTKLAAGADYELAENKAFVAYWAAIPTFNEADHEWRLATSLEAGKYYVIGSASQDKTASKTITGGYMSEIDSEIEDGVIAYNALGANTAIFLLGGNSTDGWTLTEVTTDDVLGTTANKNVSWNAGTQVWAISIAEGGNATIGGTSRILHNAANTGKRFTTYTSDLTASMLLPQLYVWTEKAFKLRYDANGGTNAPTATPAAAGKATVTDEQPTAPTGKIFDGWNENATGTGEDYVAGDEIAITTADVTIYAKWRDPYTYTVSYDANEGEGSMEADADQEEGSLYTIKPNEFTREGYGFAGWKAYDALDNELTITNGKFYIPTSNVTVKAQWNEIVTTNFVLVGNVNQLNAGDEVYIVAAASNNAMGAQDNVNYRSRVEIGKTADNGRVIITGTAPVKFTLGKVGENFTFFDGEGYLCATSSGSNYMGTQETLNDEGKWSISINANGEATIIAQGDYTRNHMRYNDNNNQERFSCYASTSTMPKVAIYKKASAEVIRGELSNGKWGTICPKQTVENAAGATFYQISYLQEQNGLPFNMVFDPITGTTLTAGQPYFFIATGEEITGIKVGVELSEADDAGVNGFYGYIGDGVKALSWKTDYVAGEDNTFVIYGNTVMRLNAATNLKSERCYININATEPTRVDPTPGAAPRRRIVVGVSGTSVATGIDALNASEAPVKMIIDGQLFIIRGEKMYNVNGQVVK